MLNSLRHLVLWPRRQTLRRRLWLNTILITHSTVMYVSSGNYQSFLLFAQAPLIQELKSKEKVEAAKQGEEQEEKMREERKATAGILKFHLLFFFFPPFPPRTKLGKYESLIEKQKSKRQQQRKRSRGREKDNRPMLQPRSNDNKHKYRSCMHLYYYQRPISQQIPPPPPQLSSAWF